MRPHTTFRFHFTLVIVLDFIIGLSGLINSFFSFCMTLKSHIYGVRHKLKLCLNRFRCRLGVITRLTSIFFSLATTLLITSSCRFVARRVNQITLASLPNLFLQFFYLILLLLNLKKALLVKSLVICHEFNKINICL